MKIIISGGGTGGHIFPAIAIANALKRKLNDCEILFVGANGRMEMMLVPKAGYAIEGLTVAGFQRKISLKNIFRNLIFPFKLLISLAKAKRIIRKFKPDIAIGVGGYASGPIMRIATRKNIPTLIQEQNSYPGITNKILSHQVDKICVAYENMDKFFPSEKVVLTGNPIRQDIQHLEGKRDEAAKYFALDGNKKTVLVIGGSLGARAINEAMRTNLEKLQNEGWQILWQTGKNFDTTKINTSIENKLSTKILPFIDKMDLAYSIADVIVSRAGAISISELSVVGKPCILVPSPNVAEDHQTKNAMALVSKKAAAMLTDNEIQDNLYPALMGINNNKDIQNELSNNLKQLVISDADDRIADVAIGLAVK
ncbi:UDP-N-acetylglucosamine--N-acetylmuramyl-(pentapeptide) pyrophosphoryl-undecaprenol N-acetylglucosamine transferase [Bacteroidia bacterium]|nr:UDP-N-acetylglucosamine--N-acetylmuramyl-(pentapeptide) pyrophosphoryl-undecaprenol N-acetylglucosamine transferase [Bacteroidia bacterium]